MHNMNGFRASMTGQEQEYAASGAQSLVWTNCKEKVEVTMRSVVFGR